MTGVTFGQAVADYVGHHLPARGCSQHTVRSYCNGLVSFLEFAESRLGKSVGSFHPGDLTFEVFSAYADDLEAGGRAASTINQRMTCVKSFMCYLAKRNIAFIQDREAVLDVERHREEEPVVSWLSLDEMKLILSMPDPGSGSGLRDLAMLSLLYDSAARVQEACDLDVGSVSMRTRTVTLYGKGKKTRIVPISAATAKIVGRYVSTKRDAGQADPLFTNRGGDRLTPAGCQWIISKYVGKARDTDGGRALDRKITPHVFRHSKAMHLLEAGVELIYIRDFLGHRSVTTTEVYAKASPEAKKKAIEAHAKQLDLSPKRISAAKEQSVIESIRAIGRGNG